MEVIRTTKTDITLKTARIENGHIIDDTGEEVNLVELIQKVYGEDEFKLSITRSSKKDLSEDEETEEE